MQRVLKKIYSLYVDYCSKRVKLCSGTLEDIDDFTTYFIDKNAIGKRLIKNESGEFLVYIESSRGKYYSPMYYNNRAILDKENFNRIYEKIEKIDREKIEEFLYNKTKVNGYLNDKNSKNIPIVNLYLSIKNNKDYKGMLYHYLKTDYKLYREFIIYFFENENLNTNKKSLSYEKMKDISSLLDIVSKEYENIQSDYKEKESTYDDLEDRIYTIMTSKELTTDQKMSELDILVDSPEIAKKYILKYEDKLTEDV